MVRSSVSRFLSQVRGKRGPSCTDAPLLKPSSLSCLSISQANFLNYKSCQWMASWERGLPSCSCSRRDACALRELVVHLRNRHLAVFVPVLQDYHDLILERNRPKICNIR